VRGCMLNYLNCRRLGIGKRLVNESCRGLNFIALGYYRINAKVSNAFQHTGIA
jgi:hypothetical protein